MERLFEQICNLSISASWLILAVLAVRYLLKKAPKKYICLLWMLVGLRLVVPFSIESSLSLIPEMNVSEVFETGMGATASEEPNRPAATGFHPYHYDVDSIYSTAGVREQEIADKPVKISVAAMLPYVWLGGSALMLLYFMGSLWTLKRRLSTAVLGENNIWQSEYVDSPFVFGVINPRIYIPYHMPEESLDYVLAHERVHIMRKDHWTKAAAFLILSIYWFHPLVWLSYVLLGKDIEIACDEQVVSVMDEENRKAYSRALLSCKGKRNWYQACPVGFGEVNVKERVIRVMNYRKPSFWVILTSVILGIVVTVCFFTSAKSEDAKDTGSVPEADMQSDEDSSAIFFEDMFYQIDMNILDVKPWDEVLDPAQGDGHCVEIGSIPEAEIEVYGYVSEQFDKRGVFIRQNETIYQFDINYTAPRLVIPKIGWDEAQKLLIMSCHNASGTGLAVDELFVISFQNPENVKLCSFSGDELNEQIENTLSYEYNETEQAVVFYDESGRELKKLDVSELQGEKVSGIDVSSMVSFYPGKETFLVVKAGVVVENWATPQWMEKDSMILRAPVSMTVSNTGEEAVDFKLGPWEAVSEENVLSAEEISVKNHAVLKDYAFQWISWNKLSQLMDMDYTERIFPAGANGRMVYRTMDGITYALPEYADGVDQIAGILLTDEKYQLGCGLSVGMDAERIEELALPLDIYVKDEVSGGLKREGDGEIFLYEGLEEGQLIDFDYAYSNHDGFVMDLEKQKEQLQKLGLPEERLSEVHFILSVFIKDEKVSGIFLGIVP